MKKINIINIIKKEGYSVSINDVGLDLNEQGDLIITLFPKSDREQVLRPEYNQVGRPQKILKEDVLELKSKGLTQEQIAQKMNVSLSTIRRNWNKRDKNKTAVIKKNEAAAIKKDEKTKPKLKLNLTL